MKIFSIITTVFTLLTSFSAVAEEFEERFSILIKTGSYSMSNGTQSTAGGTSVFETDSSSVFSGEVTFKMRNDENIRLGGEIFVFNNKYTNFGITGDALTTAVMFNARMFLLDGDFKPFVGFGAGAVTTTFDGYYSGSAGGLAMQVMIGAEYKISDRIGLYAEYKNLGLATVDNETTSGQTAEFDMSGAGTFAGVAAYF